jgi:aspartate aminotransferase
VVAESLQRLLGMPFEPADIAMTTAGLAAILVALKVVADPGDEVVYSLPPWFGNEPLCIEAGLTPVKVSIDLETFDLDLDAIAAAITPRTRIVLVNTPHNPTGRVVPVTTLTRLADMLDSASERNGRRIYLLSDEAYNRIVFDGTDYHSPLEFYPYSFMAYSYGKTLVAPGQRIGYLAMPPTMPREDREQLRVAVHAVQQASGYLFPNALLQHAIGDLERLRLDITHLQHKRDWMVDALREMGYEVHRPEGTFYLFPKSPIPDDRAFTDMLLAQNVAVLPGALFETPGYFRICLTANDEMIERGLPGFARAIAAAHDQMATHREHTVVTDGT